ncbi:glutathione synthetase [Citrobacter freundii]|nr:glutathione synthetase [Citrobacter freundii]
MAQNYLPAIKDGDKRVLVVDGETRSVLPGGVFHKAAKPVATWRPAVVASRVHLTDSDWEIARRIGPTLKAKGLDFCRSGYHW